jgi:hypothetical protein
MINFTFYLYSYIKLKRIQLIISFLSTWNWVLTLPDTFMSALLFVTNISMNNPSFIFNQYKAPPIFWLIIWDIISSLSQCYPEIGAVSLPNNKDCRGLWIYYGGWQVHSIRMMERGGFPVANHRPQHALSDTRLETGAYPSQTRKRKIPSVLF